MSDDGITFVGIDPGKNGGIAVLDADGGVVEARQMPGTERDLYDALAHAGDRAHAVLELVRASPQMGVVSAFTFGRGYGAIRMALLALGVPFDEVTPPRWQATMQCRSKGDKNVTKRRAQELFPKVKMTHAIADALLLAAYCRRLNTVQVV